ncbi:hypothetical protein CRENBAI_016751 [Crenichthys baileyi]|uniref:Uncharacterized protein n=1 Tax=Crenichthys baileyi TaxID=28760 RepID=A0AAV9QQE5_9TELE
MMTSAGKKGVPPPDTLKFPFAVLRCLVRGRGKGKRGPLAQGGKLNRSVCVWVCVWVRVCGCVSQTWPETTRIEILFERKHNKTHRNMVQEERGVILKVNKQNRRVVKVLSLLSSQQRGRGGAGPTGERLMWGFTNPSGSYVFPLAVCLTKVSLL